MELRKDEKKNVLITGVSGFVSRHFVEHYLTNTNWNIVGMARLSNVGDMDRLFDSKIVKENKDRLRWVYHDLKYDIPAHTREKIGGLDAIIHLASNSHVDRSITYPRQFVEDNVLGAVSALEFLRNYHPNARFINFGTDEIFGSAPDGYNYKERDRWNPSNPYSASKAGQIALGIAYHNTYGLDILNTYTMNIFGEGQDKEKFVPLVIDKVMKGEKITIHSKLDSDGNVEDVGTRFWLHGRNSADAVMYLLEHGVKGEHYNVVGDIELRNDVMAKKIAGYIGKPIDMQYVDFHKTRPGHDRRYGLDGTKLKELGWVPPVDFEKSLEKTVQYEIAKYNT
jgi:dTDP-glucose 4,6-dehydratase